MQTYLYRVPEFLAAAVFCLFSNMSIIDAVSDEASTIDNYGFLVFANYEGEKSEKKLNKIRVVMSCLDGTTSLDELSCRSLSAANIISGSPVASFSFNTDVGQVLNPSPISIPISNEEGIPFVSEGYLTFEKSISAYKKVLARSIIDNQAVKIAAAKGTSTDAPAHKWELGTSPTSSGAFSAKFTDKIVNDIKEYKIKSVDLGRANSQKASQLTTLLTSDFLPVYFPWPPASASATQKLYPHHFGTEIKLSTFGAYYDLITSALNEAGYKETALLSVENGHGFAVVTRLERVTRDYETVATKKRWILKRKGLDVERDGPIEYVRRLFTSSNEKFRAFVFLALKNQLKQQPITPLVDQLKNSERLGVPDMPSALSDSKVTGLHMYVLVYEFVRHSDNKELVFVERSNLGAVQQLAKATVVGGAYAD